MVPELSLLFVFLFELELVLARLELKTGSRLEDDCCPAAFFPTLDSDLVTGWLCAKEVSILLRVEELESVSEVGSREASGELLRDPVDMGEGEAAGWLGTAAGGNTGGTMGATGTSRRSKNGFLLLLGELKGFDLPMVANLGPAAWLVLSDCDWGGELLEVWEVVVVAVVEVVEVGATKLATKGLVLVRALLGVSAGWLVAGTEAPPELRKLSEKRVSLWRPATPFSEKWVTLMGSDTLEGERGGARVAMLESRSRLEGCEVRVVVVRVGELSTSIN